MCVPVLGRATAVAATAMRTVMMENCMMTEGWGSRCKCSLEVKLLDEDFSTGGREGIYTPSNMDFDNSYLGTPVHLQSPVLPPCKGPSQYSSDLQRSCTVITPYFQHTSLSCQVDRSIIKLAVSGSYTPTNNNLSASNN